MSLLGRGGVGAAVAASRALGLRRSALPALAVPLAPARVAEIDAPSRAASGAASATARPAFRAPFGAVAAASRAVFRGARSVRAALSVAASGARRSRLAASSSRAPLSTMPPAVLEGLPETPLACRADRYRGVIVEEGVPAGVSGPDPFGDPASFSAALGESLAAWRSAGVRGVWLRLGLDRSALIPVAVSHGFRFHHAEPSYAMLCAWLPTDVPDLLPPNASHQAGVGAFVLDRSRRRVLAVQEALGPLAGTGTWKLPTGLVGAGEDVHEAAVREVLEETGVATRFGALVAVRQAHGFAFGKSDLFFIVGLEVDEESRGDHPEGEGASGAGSSGAPARASPPGSPARLAHQETELDGARWMDLDEFAAQPFYASRPLFHRMLFACREWAEGRNPGLEPRKLTSDVRTRADLLFVAPNERADREAEEIAQRHDQLPDIRHG